MKTQLYIGQPSLRGAISKYAARFNLIELRAEFGRLPRSTLLRRWTEEVPSGFAFSVMLSRHVGRFGPNHEADLDLGLEIAEAVSAKWLVVQTDPTIGPSQRSRKRLQDLFARLANGGRSIAWDPRGVWQESEAVAWSHELGVTLVRDISRGDMLNEDVIYSRLPGIGTSSRMNAGAIEKAANSLIHASVAYVVVCGDGASKVSQLLRSLVQDNRSVAKSNQKILESLAVFGEGTSQGDIRAFDDELEDNCVRSDITRAQDNGECDPDDVCDSEGEVASLYDTDEDYGPREGRNASKKRQGVKR